jgi:hypothetical protein
MYIAHHDLGQRAVVDIVCADQLDSSGAARRNFGRRR